jgi:hypothetical protein
MLLAAASAAVAQDAAPAADAAPKRCLDLLRIESTEIIDDKRIVFHLSGGQMYLNTLDFACAGLSRGDPFLYKTSMSQLCDLDLITVLHQQGAGFIQGPSCGLGKFERVTKEQVAMLKRAETTHQ